MSLDIIRILILLAVFAGVFLAGSLGIEVLAKRRSHQSAINKRLEMIGRGVEREEMIGELVKRRPSELEYLPEWLRNPMTAFQKMTFASGIDASFRRIIITLAAATVVIFAIALTVLIVVGTALTLGIVQLTVIFAIALGLVVPIMVIQRMAQSRRKRMESQFPVALDIFVRALRTGHPVASAIDLLTNEMEDPIGSEFGLISDEVAYGSDLIDALEAMAERWDLDDIRMFVVSLSLQSQTGGNLAEILENISKVIRDRAQMFMKVRALSSEGRMTAWMLTVLPVLAFLLIFVGTPQYYINVADDPIFIVGSIVLLAMYVIGVITIRKMVDLKV
ncbi:MAG: type II secretion system F family protein [Erythrobacter sp.]